MKENISVKRKAKYEKELQRRIKERNKPQGKYYLLLLFIVAAIVYIVDEFSSSISASVQFEVVSEFLVGTGKVEDATKGAAIMTAMSSPVYLLMLIAPFYKSLADRFGRKVFLAINTIGMGLGMFTCMIATNIYTFIVGTLIINFAIPNDMQVMYIMETAPEKHRAKMCTATKAIGYLGVTFIAVLKKFFMADDITKWREIFLIPVICAVAIGVLCYLFIRETPVFLTRRIAVLEGRNEVTELNGTNETKEKSELISAVKFIFAHKQLRALVIAGLIFASATGVTGYYETIMHTGKMTNEDVTTAIFFFPFFNALITFLSGFLMDKFGRKKAAVTLAVICSVGLAVFVFGSQLGFPAYVVGASYGCFLGGLWSVSDLLILIIPGESTPTEIRASVLGAMNLVFNLGFALSMVIFTVGGLFVKSLGWLCLICCVPIMLVAVIVLMKKVHETKGLNLETVTGKEWD